MREEVVRKVYGERGCRGRYMGREERKVYGERVVREEVVRKVYGERGCRGRYMGREGAEEEVRAGGTWGWYEEDRRYMGMV